jgi:phosphoesterase RecJ-like protein
LATKGYGNAARAIRAARTIAIACHRHPDGDCLGSLSALGAALKKMGKRVSLYCPGSIPARYRFLPLAGRIKSGGGKGSYDLAISVDCGDRSQLGAIYKKVFARSRRILEIDHHSTRNPFGNIALIDQNASAVGEIIYNLLKRMRVRPGKAAATGMLVSFIVETSSFRLPTVTSKTFAICRELLKNDIDFYAITNRYYWIRSVAEVQLTGLSMSRIKLRMNKRLAYSHIGLSDLRRFKGKDENVDAAADEIRAIENVRAVVLFREINKKRLRVSLRSKEGVDVGKVAKIFGGGGHFDVAGCYIPNRKSSKEAVLREVAGAIRKRGRRWPY